MRIRRIGKSDWDKWLRMRAALWPDCGPEQSAREMETILGDTESQVVFAAEDESGMLVGFVEGSIHPHALGCETNPVGYVEGWWVDAAVRRRGVGRALLAACEAWAREKGCREMASDCFVENAVSFAAHRANGYAEAGRLIHFAKKINR